VARVSELAVLALGVLYIAGVFAEQTARADGACRGSCCPQCDRLTVLQFWFKSWLFGRDISRF
jgi:hypothetical protein